MIADLKKRSIHRTKIINGQFQALLKQIEDEAYCVDILTQSLAIQKALASLNKLILENHLRTHVTTMLRDTKASEHDKAISELLHLYELSNVRSK
ncbi:metal-sensitive transcriptional regulator [Polaromonas sp.]|nr:metal-sensitive transcriptional regulator [Candidatus Saccharibacteria bacterium]